VTRPDVDASEMLANAKRIVEACAIAQVGDHHSMAEVEVMAQIGQLEDPNLRYAVIKTFSGLAAALARALAKDESKAIQFVRAAVNGISYRAQPRPPNEEGSYPGDTDA
jgi:hypothetical protein